MIKIEIQEHHKEIMIDVMKQKLDTMREDLIKHKKFLQKLLDNSRDYQQYPSYIKKLQKIHEVQWALNQIL